MDNAGVGTVAVTFFVIWGVVVLAAVVAPLAVGISALISMSHQPSEAFGPWWENTKTSWLAGVAVSFLIPFGSLVTGLMWFIAGKAPLRAAIGCAGRPFWSGPPKPAPPYGYGPPPYGYGPPPYGSAPPPYGYGPGSADPQSPPGTAGPPAP